jgi:hypothetical protein
MVRWLGLSGALKSDSMQYYFRIDACLIFPVTERGIEPNGLIFVFEKSFYNDNSTEFIKSHPI